MHAVCCGFVYAGVFLVGWLPADCGVGFVGVAFGVFGE